eukprot:5364839-Prymnesium_polylepis.1
MQQHCPKRRSRQRSRLSESQWRQVPIRTTPLPKQQRARRWSFSLYISSLQISCRHRGHHHRRTEASNKPLELAHA